MLQTQRCSYFLERSKRSCCGLGAQDVPLIGKGNIFVPMTDGGMSVLDASTGSLRWKAATEPLVSVAGLVYGLTDGRLLVLRANSGTLLTWYRDIESVHFSEEGQIFAVTSIGDLIVLQANTGAILWRWPAPSPILTLTPAGALVYVSTRSDGIVALRVRNGSVFWHIAV